MHGSESTKASYIGRPGLELHLSRQALLQFGSMQQQRKSWVILLQTMFAAVLSTSCWQYLLSLDWREKLRKRRWCLHPSGTLTQIREDYQCETFSFGGRWIHPVAILIWFCLHFAALPHTPAMSCCQLSWMSSHWAWGWHTLYCRIGHTHFRTGV